MNPKLEAIVVILTAVSVIIIVFDIIFDPTGAILTFIYAFDLGVVVILAIDFYFRAKESACDFGDCHSWCTDFYAGGRLS